TSSTTGMVMNRHSLLLSLLCPLCLLMVATATAAPPPLPLHEQIDRLIEDRLAERVPGSHSGPAAPASDAEVRRRVWLDLGGMIPTGAEARAFLDDPSPYKRVHLIDRLSRVPATLGGCSRSSTCSGWSAGATNMSRSRRGVRSCSRRLPRIGRMTRS